LDLSLSQIAVLHGELCGYCGCKTSLVRGDKIYGDVKYHSKWFYVCPKCGAFVGCHPRTKNALGRVANKSLRLARVKAHHYFDLLWKQDVMSRSDAYAWLSIQLSIPKVYTHIGMFNESTCQKVANLSLKYLLYRGYNV
jgi:hypothetical protein